MNTKEAKKLIENKLPEKRFKHSLRVADTAVKLAEIYDGDGSEILHGPVCAALMKADYGIEDEETLLAIKYHTTGRKEMTKTEKLVFIADYIEPGRKTPGVEEIRDMAYNQGSLDKTIYEISKRTVLFLISKDITVYGSTIECLNYYNYSDQKIKDD